MKFYKNTQSAKLLFLMKVEVDMAIRNKGPHALLKEIRGKPFRMALMTIGQWNQGCWRNFPQ